jgi:hypothetical protein
MYPSGPASGATKTEPIGWQPAGCSPRSVSVQHRFLTVLLAVTLAACSSPPAESAISEGYAGDWPRIGPQTAAGWASFPVGADPRPLVLLGEQVSVVKDFADDPSKIMFSEGRIDAGGKVAAEAADAFAKLTKPGAADPKLKVTSVEKGTAKFATDRGPRELPAWIFRVTGVNEPVTVLAVKPDFQYPETIYSARVSPDGVTLALRLPAPPVACGGEPNITYHVEWLEPPTAVAIGLKKRTGKVVAGNVGTCRHMPNSTADYTVKLSGPLGNRVLVAANGDPLPAVSAQP